MLPRLFSRLNLLLTLLLLLSLPNSRGRAAISDCRQTIDAASLGGKTVWLTVESGEAPFDTTGSYQIKLAADGTYSVAASGAIQARSGTWNASRPAEYLILKLKNFHKDAVEDVLVFFDGCASCLSCGYSFFRENLPTGGQSGTFVLTDGENPPAPSTDIGVRGLNGGGTYQAGVSVSLFPDINYVGNPSTYSFAWSRDGVRITAPTPGFLMLQNVTPADAGVYSCVISRSGVTNTVTTRVTILATGAAPGYKGRVWTKITDWVPGLSFGRTWFRVNGGVITLGGDKSVLRWAGGKLELLVTNTTPGIDGISFSAVDSVSIESGGAFNFVVRNKLYEMRAGKASLIPTPGLSVGQIARSGNQVVFVANAGTIQNGLYLWTGTEVRTLFAPTQDPQGRLTRIEAVKSLAFDGERVVLIATAGQDTGLFSMTLGAIPALTLVAENGKTGPSGQTYRGFYRASLMGDLIFAVAEFTPLGSSVVSYERTGKATRLGNGFSGDLVTAMLAVNRPRQFHHLDSTGLEFWENSSFERYLGPNDKLDGKAVNRITHLDANEADVVVAVEFVDNTAGIYALLEAVAPPPQVNLGVPFLAGKEMQFNVPTLAGKTYTLEKTTSLVNPAWSVVETVAGTGNPHLFKILADGAGAYYRVGQTP